MINLVIATYAGYTEKFSKNLHKDKYLKYNLCLLNKIITNIDQITIMKPKINSHHIEMKNYYNFEDIHIENIKHKIKIYECENIGISYGQFITAISREPNFDYYIFIEDDYFIFKDNFENDFIKNLKNDEFLCLSIRDKIWDIFLEITDNNESYDIYNELKNKAKLYPQLNNTSFCPDFSIGILTRETVNNLLKTFISFDNIIDLFNINFRCIWIHQILFGYILTIANINISHLTDKHLILFYETTSNLIEIWNNPNLPPVDLPLFVPVDVFFNYDISKLFLSVRNLLSVNNYVQFKYRIEWFYSEIHKLNIQ